MLGQGVELVVVLGGGQDGRVAGREFTAPLPLKRSTDDRGAGRGPAVGYQPVDELDEFLGKPQGDLCAHRLMVPRWDAYWDRDSGLSAGAGGASRGHPTHSPCGRSLPSGDGI